MADRGPDHDAYADRVTAYLARVGLVANETSMCELAGDASDRRYVRVVSADGSSRVLLVHADPIDADILPFINVARLLRQIPVPVPAVLAHEADLGILVLEDLGDVTLQDHLVHATGEEQSARYLEASELLVRIQRRGHELASNEFIPFGLAFDEVKLTSELDFFVQHFLIAHRGASPSPTSLAAEFTALAAELAAEPRVLCHRDYHSRNLMLHHDQLHIIDFQDARMGPDTYDLVSLLRDSYVSLDRSSWRRSSSPTSRVLGCPTGPRSPSASIVCRCSDTSRPWVRSAIRPRCWDVTGIVTPSLARWVTSETCSSAARGTTAFERCSRATCPSSPDRFVPAAGRFANMSPRP